MRIRLSMMTQVYASDILMSVDAAYLERGRHLPKVRGRGTVPGPGMN